MRYEPIPLLRFVPALSPRWTSPVHLAKLSGVFERAITEPVRVFGTTAPRHGKTELVKHGVVHRLLADPTARIGYCSYSAKAAQKRSREMRKLYQRAGGKVDQKASSVGDWRTGHEDGGVWAAGIEGGWTGEGLDLIVIDDPIKGREFAESQLEREKLWEFYKDDLATRLEPGGSIVCVHTRWHTDDLGGRLLALEGYEHVHIPAIDANGCALWPERFPLEALRRIEKRIGPYSWSSLYMGRPFARGGRVFEGPRYIEGIPPVNLRIALGVDLAYSKKSHADWSVVVALGVDDTTETRYVLSVLRVQEPAPSFAKKLKAIQAANPYVDARWYYGGGGELGVADFMQTLDGVELDAIAAPADKFIRAQPVAAAWNDGKILVPRDAPWLDDLLLELSSFTGVNDLHDDQVDALAAAFDSSAQPGWIAAMRLGRQKGFFVG
jgi:predicted phage terminase large subunit-like protein